MSDSSSPFQRLPSGIPFTLQFLKCNRLTSASAFVPAARPTPPCPHTISPFLHIRLNVTLSWRLPSPANVSSKMTHFCACAPLLSALNNRLSTHSAGILTSKGKCKVEDSAKLFKLRVSRFPVGLTALVVSCRSGFSTTL